jgi:hypothetical protein
MDDVGGACDTPRRVPKPIKSFSKEKVTWENKR